MIIYLQMIESDEDKSKFEQLYIMYKGLMFHVAMKILKNEFDAEDAAYERKVRIGNTLRALFPILAFVLFGVLIMLLQGGRF